MGGLAVTGGVGALTAGGLALNRALEKKRAEEHEPTKKTKNDSLYYRTSMYNIADLIEDATDVRVDHVFSGDVGHDGLLSATFLSDGKFYYMEEYEPGELYFERNDSATAELNEYAYGYFDAQGLRCDSIAPYYSLMEELRLDVNCSAGNKPCGSTCIPQRYTCNVGKGATGRTKRSLRSPGKGGFGRKAALAGAGLAAVGLGGVALANRDKIGSSVKKTMERMPRTKRQIEKELNKQVMRAKRAPKSAERTAKVAMGRAGKELNRMGQRTAASPKRLERMAKVAMGNMTPERQAKLQERARRKEERLKNEAAAERSRKERIAAKGK